MIFVDGIVLTQHFREEIPELCGVRSIQYRNVGDVDRKGRRVEVEEVVGESMRTAWIQGSHDTALRIRSDGHTLSVKGNPGRLGRPDNLFNLGFLHTIHRVNEIVYQQGFPKDAFHTGERQPLLMSQVMKLDPQAEEGAQQPIHVREGWKLYTDDGQEVEPRKRTLRDPDQVPELPWSGSRVWSIHLTQNYRTGSPENALAIINWLNTQSVARVKKSRLGATTIVWGSISYCQTEVYVKADEMLAHCKTPEAKKEMLASPAYKYALENGIIRLEVKCAKDFLTFRKLTYLGNWTMGTVTELFNEKAQVLEACALEVPESDEELLLSLPKASRVYAAAWLAGIDVRVMMSKATFHRHAPTLRKVGIDISEPRNVTVIRPKMRSIAIEPVAIPEWYGLAA